MAPSAPDRARGAVADFLASRGPRPDRRGRGAPPPVPITPVPPRPTTLDLSSAAEAATLPPSPGPARRVARTRTALTVLTPAAPTVTLTRLQSGIGALDIGVFRAKEVGDLRLGCAYQLGDGQSSIVQETGDSASVEGNSATPVIVKRGGRHDRIILDLRQCRQLERLIIYAYSERDLELRWGGVLGVSTFGGSRIELPLDAEPSRGVRVALSIYRVGGEFVLRNELEAVEGSIRDACRAFGFDSITWIDGRTPVGDGTRARR